MKSTNKTTLKTLQAELDSLKSTKTPIDPINLSENKVTKSKVSSASSTKLVPQIWWYVMYQRIKKYRLFKWLLVLYNLIFQMNNIYRIWKYIKLTAIAINVLIGIVTIISTADL